MPRDDSLTVARNSSSLVNTSTSTVLAPADAAEAIFCGSRIGTVPVPSLIMVEPFSDVSMTMCSETGSSGFAAISFADSASASKRICCVALSTSFETSSALTPPRTIWKTSLSPTSASRPWSFWPARRMPIVSGERFFASRNASMPLIPGRFCADTITCIGVSPSVSNASVPLVAQCTV